MNRCVHIDLHFTSTSVTGLRQGVHSHKLPCDIMVLQETGIFLSQQIVKNVACLCEIEVMNEEIFTLCFSFFYYTLWNKERYLEGCPVLLVEVSSLVNVFG